MKIKTKPTLPPSIGMAAFPTSDTMTNRERYRRQHAISGREICRLMRVYKVPMRLIKSRMGITLKQIRHAREHGRTFPVCLGDKDGTRRAYGPFDASLKGRQLAEYLFHRNEIVDVTENADGTLSVNIATE